jgi:hypothetical protein
MEASPTRTRGGGGSGGGSVTVYEEEVQGGSVTVYGNADAIRVSG